MPVGNRKDTKTKSPKDYEVSFVVLLAGMKNVLEWNGTKERSHKNGHNPYKQAQQ